MRTQHHLNQPSNLEHLRKVHQNGSQKHLKGVHLDEIGKTGTRFSSKQDGGNIDNSKSGDLDDMDVSYDCELNLSTNLALTSFE